MRKCSLFLMMLAGLFLASQPALGALDHYWTFDSDVTDAVDGGLDGTIVGTGVSISNVAGEFQRGTGALKIVPTGSGDYVRIGSPAIPTYSPMAYTISSWFKLDDTLGVTPSENRNFVWESTPSYTTSLEVRADDKVGWYMHGTPLLLNTAQSPEVGNTWHHVAIVYDKLGGTVDYYFDGSQWGTTKTAGELYQPTTGLNIGECRYGAGTRNWQGYIDDFAIFNGTIDAAGISGLYSGTYTPETVPVVDGPEPIPTAPLMAYWTFDSDYTSEVNNDFFEGTPQGGVYTSITNVAGEFKNGGGALKLDSGPASGNGTYVDVVYPVAIPGRDDQITVSAWYKPSDVSGDGSDPRNVVWESSPGYSMAFSVGSDDDAEWAYQMVGGDTGDTVGPIVSMDEWHHVVMVMDVDEGRVQFYHDGVLYDDVPTIGDELVAMSGLHIGNHRGGNGERDFDGYIDDVAVYHGVLSPEAVAGLYDGTYTPLTVPVTYEIVPEPSSIILLLGIFVSMAVVWRRNK